MKRLHVVLRRFIHKKWVHAVEHAISRLQYLTLLTTLSATPIMSSSEKLCSCATVRNRTMLHAVDLHDAWSATMDQCNSETVQLECNRKMV